MPEFKYVLLDENTDEILMRGGWLACYMGLLSLGESRGDLYDVVLANDLDEKRSLSLTLLRADEIAVVSPHAKDREVTLASLGVAYLDEPR